MNQRKTQKDIRKPASVNQIKKKQAPFKETGNKPHDPAGRKHSLIIKGLGIFIAVLALAIYAQTLNYDFTLDDRIVIYENSLTTRGIEAIPEIFAKPFLYGSVLPDDNIYRPVAKAVFAVCWTVSPGKPGFFHFISILFYACTGFMLFLTLARFFPKNLGVPLIASLLFIVHPIHTEVVDSIKSLDEILCFLFFIISLYFLHSYLNRNKSLYLGLAAFSFFISFLSKESGITYLVVFPLVLFFLKRSKAEIIKISLAMVAVVILVLGIRYLILGASSAVKVLPADNILAGTDDFFVQRATAVYLMGKYLLLLIFPHPLVFDYTTRELGLVGLGDWRFIASLIVYLALFIFAVWKLKSRNWIGFAILFFMITFSVTSNLFIIGGSHFAERFMYAPSLGFCLAMALLADRFINRQTGAEKPPVSIKRLIMARPLLFSLTGVIALLFVIKTLAQNPVWENNIVLFEHAIKYHPESYRPHIALADDLQNPKYLAKFSKEEQNQILRRAISELKISYGLFPDVRCYDMLGVIFHVAGQYDSSFYYYKKGLDIKPDNESLNGHMGKVLNKMGKYDEAIPYLNKAISKNPNNADAYFGLALSYTNKGDNETGLKYFLKVNEINPGRADAWYYAGLIYNAKGDRAKGQEFLNKASALGGPKAE